MPPFATGILPCMPMEEQLVIGLIGMGEMGTIYVRWLVEAGWKRCACQAGHVQVLSRAVLILGSTCVICRRTVWHCTCRCKVTPCTTSCVHAEQSRGCAGMVGMTVLWDSHLVTHKSDFTVRKCLVDIAYSLFPKIVGLWNANGINPVRIAALSFSDSTITVVEASIDPSTWSAALTMAPDVGHRHSVL